jgi:hypothetical protein
MLYQLFVDDPELLPTHLRDIFIRNPMPNAPLTDGNTVLPFFLSSQFYYYVLMI